MKTVSFSQTSKIQNLFTGLSGTLLTAFVLLSIITVGLVGAVSVLLGTRTSQTLVFEELVAEVQLSEQAIINWLDERQHDLAVIVNNPSDAEQARQVLSQPDNAVVAEAFRNRLQVETGPANRFDEIFLLNTEGQVVVSTEASSVGASRADQDYFQNGLLAPFISTPFFDSTQDHSEIIMTVPVREELGGVVGILAGRLDLADLTEVILGRTGSTRTGQTYLVSQDFRFLTDPRFRPDSDEIEVRSLGIQQALTPGPTRNGEGIYENYNGVRVVGAYRWLPDLEAALLAEREESEALAGVQQLIFFSGAVAIIVLVIAAVVALFITSRIVQPVSALTEVAAAVAQGDLNRTVAVTSRNEIGVLAQVFNTMTERLRDSIGQLREQTRALETSNEISQQLTGILDLNELLRYVVDRIQTEFEFYHTQIYLVEEGTGNLVMAEGSGEAGRLLKEQGHSLTAGQGIVGTVASIGEYFLSNNVNEVLNFVRNPLLSETNSELAVPLRKGDQILGVLDIQSERINRFTADDIALMQSIANQTAIAIDNARLLAETQSALQKVERLNRRLTREAWEEFGQELITPGYRFAAKADAKITPASDAWLPPMKQAARQKQLVKHSGPGNGSPKAELAVPLVLRGEVIGVLGVKREETPDWADEEVAAVEAVANQVALALENARLSKEQEKTIVKLKDVDRLKSEFLTSMSHELRTPLNSIIGFADVLLQGIDGDLTDNALIDVQAIYNSGQHLLALINDILDLAKIEAGRMELVREALAIDEVVEDVVSASTSLLKDKPVKLFVDVPEDLPEVYADKLRVNQVMLNLVSNAAKFTEEGSITIKAELPKENPDEMMISIIDTGIGIPVALQSTIFERFRQADAGTTRKYGGTGLGLPICQQLVEMHGGRIGVKSQEGVGSEFYFTIPLAQGVVS